MTAPECKSCPFCKSQNVSQWASGSSVVCHDCGAEGPMMADHCLSHLDAIAAWNTRATPPEVVALVEALRQAGRQVRNAKTMAGLHTIEDALAAWDKRHG